MQLLRKVWENKELILMFLLFVSILGISGGITQMIRNAVKGIKEMFTPLGAIVFLGLIVIAYVFAKKLGL